VLSATILGIGSVQMPTPAQGICPSQLSERIEAIATRPEFRRSRWGVLVQTLDGVETLYARDAQNYFTPASNVKLFTTAAALTALGPQFRIRTSVYQDGANADGVILRVVGRGDPTLTDQDLQNLVQQLGDRSITHISQLIADDRFFRGSSVNPNWEWEDVQSGYGAPATSLMLNENEIRVTLTPQAIGQPLRVEWDDPSEAVRWRIENRSTTVAAGESEFVEVGRDFSQPILKVRGQLQVGSRSDQSAVSIPDPSQYFLGRLEQALESAQILVRQTQTNATSEPIVSTEVAALQSAPLSELLVPTNRDSNNLYAEALLRQLGALDSDADDFLNAGLAAVEELLTKLGVDPTGYRIADGAGLSRQNLASPAAFVQTLQVMRRSPHFVDYRNSLAVAGVSGTLRSRFQDTPVAGNLWGKTGGLTGVSSLSGYLAPPNYDPLAISILIDHSEQSGSVRRQAIDDMVMQIAQIRSCP
jgi:D-alanyl-D-alanine carboxypeptidase/D-alanyl-D-alanine-endopeptidase (penicillin-binding protein 4)